jgi:hypothetical protein
MKYSWSALVLLLLFSGCWNISKDSKKRSNYYDEYFYPIDSLKPFIYAYRDDKRPLDERFHRIYSTYNKNDSLNLVIERFNSSFRIFEAFTVNVDEHFNVLDHMLVDSDGIKRKNRVSSRAYFPTKKNKCVKFVSDFPAPVDSLVIVYESIRTVIEDKLVMEVMGKEYAAINVRDTIILHLVNPRTKEVRDNITVTNNYYAKGLGLVKWGDVDGEVVYELQKILSNRWWEEFAQ